MFPVSHSQHSGHPTLLPVFWVCQDLPASKSWLVGRKSPPSSNRITSIQSSRPYLNDSSSGSRPWFPFLLWASRPLVLPYPTRSKVHFNYCQEYLSFLPAISAISKPRVAPSSLYPQNLTQGLPFTVWMWKNECGFSQKKENGGFRANSLKGKKKAKNSPVDSKLKVCAQQLKSKHRTAKRARA